MTIQNDRNSRIITAKENLNIRKAWSGQRPSKPLPLGKKYLSLVHFTAGRGSPTELHGSRTSFIQGVVTVPPNEMILAGAAKEGEGDMAGGPQQLNCQALPVPLPNLFQQAQW